MFKEMIIRTALNSRFGRYGKLLKLDIDSKNKTIRAEVLLSGEAEAIRVDVGRYQVQTEGRGGLKLSRIQTSRPWLTELAAALGPEIFIPLEKAELLKIFL